jgi:hypothetical protein
MTPTHDSKPIRTPPVLADLLARYLSTRGTEGDTAVGEVEPFEVAAGPRVDPRAAWEDAHAAVQAQQPPSPLPLKLTAPADWPPLVFGREPIAALPFAAGNCPQMVRDLTPLLQAERLSALRPAAAKVTAPVGVQSWALEVARSGNIAEALLAVGVLRLAGQTGLAGQLLVELKGQAPAEWRTALANEEAAVAWQEGRWEEAAERWLTLPPSVPVLFNRGLADLFLDRPVEARASFARAVELLPDSSAWHHLGRLYLALAEMRGAAEA